jgi:hypothetical protein
VCPCRQGMARPQVANGGTACRYGRWLRIYKISSRAQPTRGGTPAWGMGEVLTTPHREKLTMLRTGYKKWGNLR